MNVAFLLALVTIVATTISQAMLKHGMSSIGSISPRDGQVFELLSRLLKEPFIVGGLVILVIAMPLWLEVLSRLPLSVAYPMVSFGYVIAVVIGAVVFKENITPLRIGGVSMIVLGVIAVTRSQ